METVIINALIMELSTRGWIIPNTVHCSSDTTIMFHESGYSLNLYFVLHEKRVVLHYRLYKASMKKEKHKEYITEKSLKPLSQGEFLEMPALEQHIIFGKVY